MLGFRFFTNAKIKPFFALTSLFLGVFGYYILIWQDLAGFVRAVDHTDLFFGDFVLYYLPQSAEILNPDPEAIFGYFYSAFFAILLSPLSLLTERSATWVWGIFQVVLLALLINIRGLKNLKTLEGFFYIFLCLVSLPILNNFKWGQTSVLLTVCVFGAFHLYSSGRPVWAGVLLAFSAAIKYYTGIFALIFLFRLDRRALIAFTLGFVFFFVFIPCVVIGPREWVNFQRQTFDNISIADSKWMPEDVNSQYVVSVGARNFYGPSEPVSPRLVALLKYGGYFVMLINIFLVWLLHKSKDLDLQVTALFTAIPFFLQTSWLHYFVFLPFAQITLLATMLNLSGKPRLLAVFPMLSAVFSSIFLYNFIADWQSFSSSGWIFIANALLLPPLYWHFKLRRSLYTG